MAHPVVMSCSINREMVRCGRLWRMQVRLWRSVGSLQYFTSNQWSFDMTNVVNLLSRMCAEDRQVV